MNTVIPEAARNLVLMDGRKVPIRTCVSCKQSSEKKSLLRIVRGSDGGVQIDRTGKAPGRGAYLCGEKDCLRLAIKQKRLGRALRCDVPGSVIEELESIVVNDDAGK